MEEKIKLSVFAKVIVGQICIILFAIIAFYFLGNELSAKSAFYGGIAALIPNVYFARKVSQHKGQEAKKVVQSFYAGESGKLIMTAILFAVIFQDPRLDVIAMLTVYMSALTVFWFALLIRKY
ncbi:ATP synthase subunit I [methanotrophic endosymbiont of Bathymodiolus puteoserpentis (Logatchev)]|uniref:ATP synthase subunit I n=1 Tax=methanotrophic endosymbiont of Bathymodiolus puteoserpentis (Logatchev) TaxID=343235 RepID=UPI0013CB6848|nr:ATP synthase subunit I [methanotrophic endosymbiont of Bathymodiolus puteoserpentis (Logatchev)]SHE23352.1 FIG048548: ATP synthase protein I2 [methanotrophic endosymbiont of Bathymodiolus puteoserpentis (Logatchev)]